MLAKNYQNKLYEKSAHPKGFLVKRQLQAPESTTSSPRRCSYCPHKRLLGWNDNWNASIFYWQWILSQKSESKPLELFLWSPGKDSGTTELGKVRPVINTTVTAGSGLQTAHNWCIIPANAHKDGFLLSITLIGRILAIRCCSGGARSVGYRTHLQQMEGFCPLMAPKLGTLCCRPCKTENNHQKWNQDTFQMNWILPYALQPSSDLTWHQIKIPRNLFSLQYGARPWGWIHHGKTTTF